MNPMIQQELTELIKENERMIKKNQELASKIQKLEREKRMAFEELDKLRAAFKDSFKSNK